MMPYERKMHAIREIAATLNPIPLRELAEEMLRLAHALEEEEKLRSTNE